MIKIVIRASLWLTDVQMQAKAFFLTMIFVELCVLKSFFRAYVLVLYETLYAGYTQNENCVYTCVNVRLCRGYGGRRG